MSKKQPTIEDIHAEAKEVNRFMMRQPERDRIPARRFKGIKKGAVLEAVNTLGSSTAEGIGDYLGLPPQHRKEGVLFHLHALAAEGTISRDVSDQQTFYSRR